MPDIYVFIAIMAFAVIGFYFTIREIISILSWKEDSEDDEEPP